jgi:hypothetical protein
MKKTLVALAVLAASGASFAQVAITGTVAMGYAAGKDVNGAESSGLGIDTTALNFNATEDLGGGKKISVNQGFDGMNRAGVAGNDTNMTLSTPSYSLTLASTLLADYLVAGIANQAGLFNGFEGRLVSPKNVKDSIGVSVPMGALTFSATHYEGTGTSLGLGVGATGVSNQRNNQFQVAYAAGALAANGAYKAYDNQDNTSATSTKSIARASVSYNLGVASIGAGIAASTLAKEGTDTESMLSVGVPFGSFTFGAALMNRTISGTAANDVNLSGYGLELDYALSKSTKIATNYMSWQQKGIAASAAVTPAITTAVNQYSGNGSTLFEIALVKSF